MDTVSLIKTILDDQEFGWLKESAAVNNLWGGTMMELETLVKNFVPGAATDKKIDAATKKHWKRRYDAAVERIERAQIKTKPDGFEKYYALRSEWDSYITSLAPTFCYDLDEIDTALAKVK